MTVTPSWWRSTCVPVFCRFTLVERADRQWRFLPGPARTLPVAVTLKRFFTEDFVFILGIWDLLGRGCGPGGGRGGAAGHAHTGPGARRGAAYSHAARGMQAAPADRICCVAAARGRA